MFGLKCAYCHKPLQAIDFYLEKPEGIVCSRCIVKHKIQVRSSQRMLGSYTEQPKLSPEYGIPVPGEPLSHPSMEQVLVQELDQLLKNA